LSELQEAILRERTIELIARNNSKPHIIRRVLERFQKCIKK